MNVPNSTSLSTLGCPLSHPFCVLWDSSVNPCGFHPPLQSDLVLMGHWRWPEWLCLSRAAGEAECYAKSNEEVNHSAQHKTAVMAKQSQGLLHVAWMTQQGGCPSATGNRRANWIVQMSHAKTASNLNRVAQ